MELLLFPDLMPMADYETEMRRSRLAARVLRMDGPELDIYEALADQAEQRGVAEISTGVTVYALEDWTSVPMGAPGSPASFR